MIYRIAKTQNDNSNANLSDENSGLNAVLVFRVCFLAPPVEVAAPKATPEPALAGPPAPLEGLTFCASADPDSDSDSDSDPHPKRRSQSSRQCHPGRGGPRRRSKFTTKRLGEIAEAFFLAKAANLGFTVLKPWGDSEAYDFVLDAHRGAGGLSRVQVKSASRRNLDRGYNIKADSVTRRAYSPYDVDAFIAYVVPENAWYVIPIRDLHRARCISLFPSSKLRRSKWEKYREAWEQLEFNQGEKPSSAADERR